MREILFRGKRKDNGEWAEGQYYRRTYYYGDESEGHYIITSTETLDFDQALEYEEVIPETLGQYTGLTDKNGNKIFEGDVVDIRNTDVYECEGPAAQDDPLVTVTYETYLGGFNPFANYDCDCGMYCPSNEVMVIGNIHDDPELLEKGVNVDAK